MIKRIFFLLLFIYTSGNISGQKDILLSLPDPLIMNNGLRVKTPGEWFNKRREELLQLFSGEMYGQSPGKPDYITFEVFDNDPEALNGKATRRQVNIKLKTSGKEVSIPVLMYLPKPVRKGPAPAIVALNFWGNHTIHPDCNIKLPDSWIEEHTTYVDLSCVDNNRATERCRGINASQWPVEKIIDKGYAIVTVYREDIATDRPENGFTTGVHILYPDLQQQEDNFSTISAWAWGLSRIMDYLETDEDIDTNRIALFGWSRLGKAALWAGANDQRFSLIISNQSGAGGAKLFHRNTGEKINRLCTVFPHWYSKSFRKYIDKDSILPFDQHMVISLIAPRPVYIGSAEDDTLADPTGEFLGALGADRVYRFLGTEGLPVKEIPPLNESVQGQIGYHIRSGAHDVTDYDWNNYLNFIDKHFKK